jgi:murein DD-endopeptidase MepM/ murein hydrolase activator NlpD
MKIIATLVLLLATGPVWVSPAPLHNLAGAVARVWAPVGEASESRAWAGLHTRLRLGIWQWPVHGSGGGPPQILRGFHPPAQRWLAGHRGVDLAAPEGTPVLAAGPGTISYAGTLFGQGVVVISHGSVRTSYEPVTPSVHVGDVVARGSPIGTLAAGHCAGRACLHWGLLTGHRHGVRYYDPLVLLGLSHLRLEPVT